MIKELGCSRCFVKNHSFTGAAWSKRFTAGWCLVVLTCFLLMAVYANQSSAQATNVQAMDASQVRTVLNSLKMINYYPAQNAQTNMWRNWDPQVLDRDFTKIAGLHANTIRLAVFPEVMGFPEPTAQERMKLAQAIEIARSHGLRVKLTLFGFFDRFADTGASKVWIQLILGPYQTRRAIACIHLFNYLDLTPP